MVFELFVTVFLFRNVLNKIKNECDEIEREVDNLLFTRNGNNMMKDNYKRKKAKNKHTFYCIKMKNNERMRFISF